MTRPLPLQKIVRITGIALSLVVGVAIVVLSLLSPGKVSNVVPSWLPFADKGAHMLAYAAMGLSLFLACIRIPGSGKTPSWKRYMSTQNMRLTSWSGYAALEVLIIGIVLGVIMELLQPLTGRTADFADFIADLLGLLVGIAVGMLLLSLLDSWFAGRPWLYDPSIIPEATAPTPSRNRTITDALAKAVANAAIVLPTDVVQALEGARSQEAKKLEALTLDGEPSDLLVQERLLHCKASLGVYDMIFENLKLAQQRHLPLCQDTGMFIVFAEVGTLCPLSSREIEHIINDALLQAVQESSFRRSIVSDPVYERVNTTTNLPAQIYWNPIDGDTLKISVMLKGFGSENCGSVRMLNPTGGEQAVIDAVLDIVAKAGGKPCPPIFLGVGIGGTMDYAAVLSKRALLRDVGTCNEDARYAQLEQKLLERVQGLGIGAGGLGGSITAMSVAIETAPTHIAGMPVAVSISCWADRKASLTISGLISGKLVVREGLDV